MKNMPTRILNELLERPVLSTEAINTISDSRSVAGIGDYQDKFWASMTVLLFCRLTEFF
jgi:hypothetical protein